MRKLLAVMFFVASASPALASDDTRIVGLGKDRENLTSEQLQMRTEKLIESSEFWVLRTKQAGDTPDRVYDERTWQMINQVGKEKGIDPYLIAALGMIESNWDNKVVSHSGPVGIFQFTAKAAKDLALKVSYTIKKIVTEKLLWRGKGKSRRQVPVKQTTLQKIPNDERTDIEKSLRAFTDRFLMYRRIYGREDFAIQQHHNGPGRILKAISLYTGKTATEKNVAQLIRQSELTFPKLYFGNTTKFRPKLFEYLDQIPDFGSRYYFHVMEAYRLLKIARENPELYFQRFEMYRSPFKPDRVSPSRMWYFYTPDQLNSLQFATLEDIWDASYVRLFPLPKPWEQFGYRPRLKGEGPIASKDILHQSDYLQAESSVIGCLIYLLDEIKLLQASTFVPYEITSLVRSQAYQNLLLMDKGSKASSEFPTHTIGKAVDLPVAGMKKDRQQDLRFVLLEMESLGMISYSAEYFTPKGKKPILVSYHIVPAPDWEDYFENMYYSKTTLRAANAPGQ